MCMYVYIWHILIILLFPVILHKYIVKPVAYIHLFKCIFQGKYEKHLRNRRTTEKSMYGVGGCCEHCLE